MPHATAAAPARHAAQPHCEPLGQRTARSRLGLDAVPARPGRRGTRAVARRARAGYVMKPRSLVREVGEVREHLVDVGRGMPNQLAERGADLVDRGRRDPRAIAARVVRAPRTSEIGKRAVHVAALDRHRPPRSGGRPTRGRRRALALPMNVRLKSDIVNCVDVVGDAGGDRVVVERLHRREQLVEQVGLVGDGVRVRVVAAHAHEEELALDARGGATVDQPRHLPQLLRDAGVEQVAVDGERRGDDRRQRRRSRSGLAVSLAGQRLVEDAGAPSTTWLPVAGRRDQRLQRVVARHRHRVAPLPRDGDAAVLRNDERRRGRCRT